MVTNDISRSFTLSSGEIGPSLFSCDGNTCASGGAEVEVVFCWEESWRSTTAADFALCVRMRTSSLLEVAGSGFWWQEIGKKLLGRPPTVEEEER